MASPHRITVLGGDGAAYDVFEVVSLDDRTLRVRALLLFEVGEELRLAITVDDTVREVPGRVEAHEGSGDDTITRIVLATT